MQRTMLAAAALAAAAAALVLLGWARAESAPPQNEGRVAHKVATIAADMQPGTVPSRTEVVVAAATTKIDFDATVTRLIDLSLRAADEVARQDMTSAKATDAEAFELVRSVLEHISNYEERALFALTGNGEIDDTRAAITRSILERFLYFGLQKHATFARAGNPRALNAFLGTLLDSMVPDERTATVVTKLLADKPYLNAPQEDAVLRLVEMVPTYPWLMDPMRHLLLTLWRNLEASGQRPRDRLETLALMLKDDTNPARRAAALEHLLMSNDRQLIEFVVQDVEDQRDASRACDLAWAAAGKLPADVGLSVVRRLRAVAARSLSGPAIELARRDESLVRAAYDQLLSATENPDLRADLVTGLGFNPSRENLATVKTAFDRDPALAVRKRALLALTANAATALGEQIVNAALDDRELCGARGERLGVIVAALENMASAGENEAVARLGAQLARRPDLPPGARTELERLLQHGPDRTKPPGRSR